MDNQRQDFLSQGLWDILEPQCVFPHELLKKLKQHFEKLGFSNLIDKIIPYHFLYPKEGFIEPEKYLTFICKWNFRDLLIAEMDEILKNQKNPSQFEKIALEFLTHEGFEINMPLICPDEIVQIPNFTDRQSTYSNKLPREFYCLSNEITGLEFKAIEKLTRDIQTRFYSAEIINPNKDCRHYFESPA